MVFYQRNTVFNRHIERLPNCGTCGASEESIKHVLMECTVVRIFWRITKDTTSTKIPKLQEVTWARDLLDGKICSRKDAAIILCGMWSLWMQRNTVSWRNVFADPKGHGVGS
jgi:hypothetical protein